MNDQVTHVIPVNPNDVLAIAARTDTLGKPVSLKAIGPGLVGFDTVPRTIRFRMCGNDEPNGVIVTLNSDGTWKAETPFAIGGKPVLEK
jgi:hypothetical protein